MKIENILRKNIEEYLLESYSIKSANFDISRTKKEFKGQITIILFPLIPLIPHMKSKSRMMIQIFRKLYQVL